MFIGLLRYEYIGICKVVCKNKKEYNVYVIENLGDSCVLFIGLRIKIYGVRLFCENFDCFWESGRVCGVDGKNYRSVCYVVRLWVLLKIFKKILKWKCVK